MIDGFRVQETRRSFMQRLFAILIAVAMLAGCKSPGTSAPSTGGAVESARGPAPTTYTTASISRTQDSRGNVASGSLTISDPQKIAQLAAYFPNAGTGQRSDESSAWTASVTVRLKTTAGRTVRVRSNYKVWSEGLGDWPLPERFGRFIDGLFAGQ
jgi:hypothetical protein